MHVGEHIKSKDKLVYRVISVLQSMLNQNGGANKPRHRWKNVFDKDWKNPGNTRWWAKFELIIFLQANWNNFITFVGGVSEDDDVDIVVQYNNENREDIELKGKRIKTLKDILNDVFQNTTSDLKSI